MSKVNYAIGRNSMVLNFDGQTINVHKSDTRFNPILKAIKEGRLSDIPDLLDNTKLFTKFKGVTVEDERLFLDGVEMPESLSKKIFDFAEQELPIEPLIKFFEKLSKNPSFNSRKMLHSFLEHNGHPITQDGNFIAYRGVTEDFKDCRTKTFDNSVGSVCEMDRSLVDENPNNTCSHGLHVACYGYANGFGRVTIEVEVNPEDVVAVPVDYNGTKMRVCRFKVVNVCQNERQELLYESDEVLDDEHDSLFEVGDYVRCELEEGIFEVVAVDFEFYTLIDITGKEFVAHESDLISY